MAPRKPQTEKKAKGLIKGVGDYKGKTLNLTKKQLGKSGTAAAQKRTVSISDTKYENKKVLGPGGKALTGTVDLGGGNMAVYKNGVRVRAAAKKTVSSKNEKNYSATNSTATVTDKAATTRITPKPSATSKVLTPRQQSAALRGEKAAARTGRTYANKNSGPSAFRASTVRATGMGPSIPKPKPGQKRTVIINGVKVNQIYDARAKKWLRY